MEIQNRNGIIEITSSTKSKIKFDTKTNEVFIDNFQASYPGEFEKSGILLKVKEYQENLFYSFGIDGKNLLIISFDSFDLKEEIMSFFGDVDILIIVGTKISAKIYENIEARVVIPYGKSKYEFLLELGQHISETNNYKLKNELSDYVSEFINLAQIT